MGKIKYGRFKKRKDENLMPWWGWIVLFIVGLLAIINIINNLPGVTILRGN